MPSQTLLRRAIAALMLAIGGASHARQCDPYGIDECPDTPNPPVTWRTVGAVTDTCDNEIFRVYGEGSLTGYPDIEVSPHTDCTWNLVIKTRSSGSGAYRVRAMQPGVRFNLIRLEKYTGQSDHHVTLSIGGDYPVESVRILGPFDEDGGAVSTGVTVTLTGDNSGIDVSGNVLEDVPSLGLVAVRDVLNLQLGGDVGYSNEVKTSTFTTEYINNLEIARNLIAQLSVTDTDFNGVSISTLTVGGRMGLEEPEGMLEEQTGDLSTEGTIRLLTVGEVGPEADIGVGALSVAGFAAIERLVVSDASPGTGDFRGWLTASTPFDSFGVGTTSHQLQIVGDLYGRLEFDEPIENYFDEEEQEYLPVIVIGGSFKEGAEIVVPEDGFVGQVVINRLDDGGTWEEGTTPARVIVGSGGGQIVIDEPMYELDADEFGGGEVGLAPFTIYYEETTPPHGVIIVTPPPTILNCEEWNPVNGTPTALRIAHYGPVTCAGDETGGFEDSPVMIERKLLTPEAEWEEVDYEDWKVTLESPAGRGKSVVKCELAVGGGLAANYSYRVRPFTSQGGDLYGSNPLKCRGVAGEPDVVFWTYTLRVEYECEMFMLALYDLNDDEAIDALDILAWIEAPVDFNQDFIADGADFELIVDAAD
jgi:hypothetical protein